jgi:heptosyltransferase-2
VVLLMSGGKTKPTWNREWGFANFQALANALAPHADLMQLSGDRPLQLDGGAAVRYPRLGVREAAAALAACDAFVTQEGGLMHLARAVSAPTVAIFGGTILPAQSGYAEQTNLFQERECAPCLEQRRNCPHLNCMAAITVRRVFEAVTRLLAQRGFSLPPEAIASAPDRWTPPEFLTDLESR